MVSRKLVSRYSSVLSDILRSRAPIGVAVRVDINGWVMVDSGGVGIGPGGTGGPVDTNDVVLLPLLRLLVGIYFCGTVTESDIRGGASLGFAG